MDSLLVMARLVSLLLGTVMAFVAWRLLRQNADRRAARVEALQALSDTEFAPVARYPEAGSGYPEAGSLDPAILRTESPADHFFETPERDFDLAHGR